MKKKFDVAKHSLVPKHVKMADKETKELLDKFKISSRELPKISIKDPAIQSLNPKAGDVIKIFRQSRTAGQSVFYRSVINV